VNSASPDNVSSVGHEKKKHGTTVLRLCVIVIGMFGFGWALIPLYDLLCEITGLVAVRVISMFMTPPRLTLIDPGW